MHKPRLVSAWLACCWVGMPYFASGFEGFLEPIETVDISSPQTGVLQKVEVSEGDRVEVGDILAVLDYRLIDASRKIARLKMNSNASLLAAQAELELANRKRTQFEKLHAAGNARTDELEQARLQERLAEAQVTRAREQLAVAELEHRRIGAEIEMHHIRSPINGEVITINRDSGELVAASQGPFIRVVNIDRLKFVSNLPESVAEQIDEGDDVRVMLDGSEEALDAKVTYLSDIIDPVSGTIKITLEIDSPGGARSGSPGRIVID